MLSETDCIKVLQNYLHKTDIKFKNFELKPISEHTEGFMGEHYKLIIKHELNGKEKIDRFFIKTKPMKNELQQEMVLALGMCKREIFLYDNLLREFNKYGFDTSFASNSYLCIPDKALVMEDLTLKAFCITERSESLSLDHIKCVLKALALFHAAGFAYEKVKSQELGRKFSLSEEYGEYMNESFFVKYTDPTSFAMRWVKCIEKMCFALVPLLPGTEKYRQHFEKLLKKFEFGKVFAENININKSCGHGDLWSNNIMFKYEESTPIDCRLLDFQLVRYFYPSMDIILLVFCNTNAEFRKMHLEDLYKFYHNTLGEMMHKYGYSINEIHPWEDFYRSINIVKADALTQVLLTKCIVNLPKENITNIVNADDTGVTELMFNNDKFITQAFINDSEYREESIEIMAEIYKALQNKL